MTRASRIAEAVQDRRDRLGGADEDALKLIFANEREDEFEEWLFSRLERDVQDDIADAIDTGRNIAA